MKRSLLFLSFIFSSFMLMAQGLPSFEGSKSTSSVLLQKIVPPSPTAASIGKYGDQHINMFTGTSAVNIPIYEIKTNGYSIPLSLAYSTSGMRVSEAASWVGLGWSLLGTGVVTRVVKGAPDGIQSPLNIRSWPIPYSYTQPSDNAWNGIHNLLELGIMDPEPDIYIVKAGNLNFKFYRDLYGRIQTIPYNNDIKIKFDAVADQYTITDDDGTQYFFGGTSTKDNEITMSSNPNYANYTTSWFLSKIITPVGAQILYNNIKGISISEQDQYSEAEEIKENGQTGDCASSTASGRKTQWSTQTFYPVFLNSIETDQEIVYLVRDVTVRLDMPGDYALTAIKVYSKSSAKYEFNFSLAYSYFPQVSTTCWGNGASPAHPHSLTAICKRLRLDQFVEKGFEGNTSGFKSYQFIYSTKVVPARCSLDQDFWGYYNGAGNTSLLPSVTDPTFQASTFNAISREANPNYGDAGMLQKIIYPTGGETDFIYEPNEVNSVASGPAFQTVTATLSGTSPSLQNSVTFTIANAQQVTINFTLSDPNLLDQGLQRKAELIDQGGTVRYAGLNSNSPANGIIVSGTPYPSNLPPGTYTLKVSRNYLYSSYPSVTPVSLVASVTYAPSSSSTVVSRKIGGFRIKKVLDKSDATGADVNLKEFFYESPYFVADIQNSDCLSNYSRWYIAYVNGSANHTYQCFFRSRTISSVQPIGSVQGSHIAYGKVTCLYGTSGSNGKTEYHYSTDSDQGGFSLTPLYRPITSFDHRRGNLIRQVEYDASGNIIKIKANNYVYTQGYAGLFSGAYYTRDEPLISVFNASLIPYKIISFTDFALPSEWVRIKNSTETIFQGSNYLSTIKEFSYDNPNYSYVTQTKVTNSKSDTITQTNKYPLDYKPTTPSSNEEIERKFEADYQVLFNSFVSCDNAAAPGDATAINACYATYQTGYDNLINNRAAALANYQTTFNSLASGTADPILKAKYQLISKNKVSELIESKVTQNSTLELSKTTNDYKDFSGNILLEKINKSFSGNSLDNELKVDAYDIYGNILQATPIEGIVRSFIWDYQYQYPIAKVENAPYAEIAYTSFEANGKGNWTFSGTPINDVTSPTGKWCYQLGSQISKTGLASTAIYKVSYWKKSGTVSVSNSTATITGRSVKGWTYYEHTVTNPASGTITITGTNGIVDELRLYPVKAVMATYTFEPLYGVSSENDANNRMKYYEYDEMHRVVLVRDQDENILKKIAYNYSGQPENTSIFYNVIKTGTKRKSNCTSCLVGTYVTYTVPANSYSSTLSQVDADQKAQVDVNANDQTYADANGTCVAAANAPTTASNAIAASFTVQFHNNCTNVNYNFSISPSSSNVPLAGLKEGNYLVTMNPISGTGVYTYRVNAITQRTTFASFTVDLTTSSNTLTITP